MAKRKKSPSDFQKQVNFRVTDAELTKLMARAERAGLSLTAYCKRAALRLKVQEPPFDREFVRKRSAEMSHAWANLNQIAKRVNSGEAEAVQELAEIRAVLESEWSAVVMGEKPKPLNEAEPSAAPEVVEKPEPVKPPQVAQTAEATEQPEETKPTVCELCGEPLKEWSRDYGTFLSCPNHHAKGDGHTIIRIR